MSNPEAGWYPDPENAARMRYFDGGQWTDHYHDPQAPAVPPGGTAPAPQRAAALSSPGELLGAAWNGVRARLGPLLGLTIGVAVAVGILYAIFIALLISQVDNVGLLDGDFGDSFATLIIGSIVFGLILGLIYAIYALITSRLLQLHHRGYDASLDAAWTKSKERLWGFYGTSIVLYIGFYIGLIILGAILAQIAAAAVVLLIVPVVFLWVKLGFLPNAAVATNRGQSMLSASAGVSSGRFWPVLGRMVVLVLPMIAVYVVGFILIYASGDNPSGGIAIISVLILFVGGLLSALVMTSGLSKLYLESGAPSDI